MAPVEDHRPTLIAAVRPWIDLDPVTAGTMLAYLDRVLEVNRTLNLTAVRDPGEAVHRHLADSLAFALHVAEAGVPGRVVDVGTGGGFPGVPIAIAWPGCEVLLLDATRKKVDAVASVASDLGIRNVRARWSRAETLTDVAPADAVTARAVGPLADLVRRTRRLLAPGGCVVAWKSDVVPGAEREEAMVAARRAGMESLPDLVYELGARRRLVRFRRPPGGES
jgi:16S rRNA (guanine527-N7)-methyltransferase